MSHNRFWKSGNLKIELTLIFCLLLFLSLPRGVNADNRGITIRPISPLGEAVTGDQWLFVVGINTYLEWPQLNTAVSDAKAVRDVLLSRYHFNKQHLVELYDEEATRKNILDRLRYLAKHVGKRDSLVIFYAGHGHLDSLTKEGSWIPVESGTKDVSAWISNHDIKNYLRVDAIKAKHILLISDSCFSGDFFRGKRGKLPEATPATVKKAYQLTSRQAITSGGLEPVSDAGFGNNSIFSHFLVRALEENQKPFIIPTEIFPQIKTGVAENAEQFPIIGSLSGTGGQPGGELVLFLNHGAQMDDLSAEAAAKKKEYDRLIRMESEAKIARKKEIEEITRRERELAELDTKIDQMRKRLGTITTRNNNSLDEILAMVKKKDDQQHRLDELKRQREEEEAKRHAEIKRLEDERREKRLTTAAEDVTKYKKIVSSPFGKKMEVEVWQSLIARYPQETKGLDVGDVQLLLCRIQTGDFDLKEISLWQNILGMEFVYIMPGSFMINRNSDKRQHKVTLTEGYYLQTTEVTQGQWQKVMGNNPSHFKHCGDNCPVENVSWEDVQKFIQKLNQRENKHRYRLPTEAEWEYAARSGTKTPFSFGETLSTDQANYNGNYPYDSSPQGIYRQKTIPVKSFPANAWGLYDMHGNVWEWCQDWKDNYFNGSTTDPQGPSSGTHRVLRGGSWNSSAGGCRSAHRGKETPSNRYNGNGFRLATPLFSR